MMTSDVSWLTKARPWIWSTVVAVGAIAATFVFTGRPVYEARAAIQIESSTEIQNDSLVLKAARQVGLQADAEFNQPSGNAALIQNTKKHLTLRRDGSSPLLEILFSASDPQRAATFVNALVDAYSGEQRSQAIAAAAELTAQIETLQAAIDESETKLAGFDKLSAAEAEALVLETNRRQQAYNELIQRASIPRAVTHFVARAEVPIEPVNSNPWAGLKFGIPMSLLGGLLFFVSRKRLRQMPGPVAQPDIMCAPERSDKPVVAVSNAGTGFTNPETLVDFVENLLATNRTVLIVDCELGGALTESVGLRGELGFSDFLMDHTALEGAIPAWRTNRAGVSVMPAGSLPFRISGLLSRPNVREALAELVAIYDRVVINAPAVLTTGEMRDLSPLVDGVILVAPQDRSVSLGWFAARQVEEFGGKVIGLVQDSNQLAVV